MSDSRGDVVTTRWPELGVAALLIAVGALVVFDSVRLGTGWADDGPRSGYFPFYVGSLLTAAGAWIFVAQLWRWSRTATVFAERGQLAQVMAMAVPIVVYVAAIFPLGLYAASILLIAYFMKRYGGYGWAATSGVALGVTAVLFLVFERWFLVPLPKGPLESLLGL